MGSVTTNYYVIDGTLRRMTSGTNTLQFIYGNGLSSVIYNGVEYWYIFNVQGDVIGLINASGSYVVQYTYDSWGKILSQTDSDLARLNPFRYRGYIYDEETGFYYVSSRYYDPEIGRWLNADNVAYLGVRGVSDYNLFAYCGNNPIIRYDVGGDFWNTIIGAIGGAIAGGVSAAISGTDIGAGMLSGAMSGAITGAAIDVTVFCSIAAPVALPAIALAGGVSTAAASYTNQRLNGTSHKDVDYEAVVVDSLWGTVGGFISGAIADVGGATCQSFGQILSQSTKQIAQQATYDLTMATIVSTGTALCATGTSSVRDSSDNRKLLPSQTAIYSSSKDWFRYRYGGLW